MGSELPDKNEFKKQEKFTQSIMTQWLRAINAILIIVEEYLHSRIKEIRGVAIPRYKL